jgi:putative acetyltransferase
LLLRAGRPADTPALVDLFRAAVRIGAAPHYDAAQRAAWAPDDLAAADWAPRLARQHVLIAEIDAVPAGFIAWDAAGHIDLLFTTPAQMRRGIASALYRAAEDAARAAGVDELTTNASHGSRPLFARHGWETLAAETVVLDGVALERFRMRKRLGTP